MKKTVLLVIFSLIALSAAGWGKLGHAVIAEIAQRHLSPEAKANIDKYTGGVPMASFASWMDIVRNDPPYDKMFSGYHASICTADCKSPLFVRIQYRDGKDGVTAVEFYKECLKDYRDMPDSVVRDCIKALTHIVGDFHCPAHVRYVDADNSLKYNVVFMGDTVRFHNVWDSGVVSRASGLKWTEYAEYADRLDTWNKKQIKAATEGWAREWFEDAARDIRPIVKTVPKYATLDKEFVDNNIALAELELRKAGYQLAKLLNAIFE